MYNILIIIVLFLLTLLILLFELIFFVSVIGGLKNKVPFIPAPKAVLEEIAKALVLKDGSVFYDLGCGDGQILFYLSRRNPRIRCVGFENNIYPILLVKLRLFFSSEEEKKGITIMNGNFFKQDLKDATHVFVYLSSDLMDRLLPKFEKELTLGTRLVSLSFPFENKKPIQIIDLKRKKHQLGRELYVYQF